MLRLSAFPSVRIHKSLLAVCFMLFFWTLFDGTVSYISPIAINHAGYSDTVLGIILGSSSIAGAVFDFLLSKYLRNSSFRRVYLLMFVLCSLFPVILWNAKIIWMFLLAMGVWGLYYDLVSFGTFDFVGRMFREEEHSSSFGIISVFKEFGYTLAPLIAGLTLGALLIVDWKPIFLMYIFLFISILFFFILFYTTRGKTEELISPPIIKSQIQFWKSHFGLKLAKSYLLHCF